MRHKDATFNDAIAALDALNGVTGLRAVTAGRPFEPVEYGDELIGRYTALRKKLGDDITKKLLADEVRIVAKDEQALAVEIMPVRLFDKNGRRIPSRGLKASVNPPNRNFYLTKPNNDHVQILARYQHAFETEKGWPSVGEFQDKIGALEMRLRADELTADVLGGFGFDFCIPMTPKGDLGKIMDDRFVAALGRAYTKQVGRSFNNYRHNDLEKEVSIISGSRHEQVVERTSQGYVIGKFFPCLQGFSVNADREQMETLPDVFLLNGGFDTCSAIIGHADNFGRDNNTPGIDFASLQWRSARYSVCFGASGGRAYFVYGGDLGYARGLYSAALVVLG